MAKKLGIDYSDPAIREEILIRQRQDMWTPEQIGSLAKHFRLQPGMALLDAGCGYGYCLRTYGPSCMPGGRLVGVDREPDLLKTAARMTVDEGLGDAATFREGDIDQLPFERDTFDAVLVQVVMCHLAHPEDALDELIRVAKPGGCIAIFDNAVSGGEEGWTNTEQPSIEQRLARFEQSLVAHDGRQKLGLGDWSVGLKMPSWMEARGLEDVDVRVNERVNWIAPPYRSPGQQSSLRHTRAYCKDKSFSQMNARNTVDALRAAGADEKMVENAVREHEIREARFREAVANETAAFAHGGTFWCIWGFKPSDRSAL